MEEKMKYRRRIWLFLLCLFLLPGCGRKGKEEKEEPKIVISVLAGQSTSDAGIEDMIDEWLQNNYPNVAFEWECVDWGDGFHSKIQGHFAAGDVPDLIIGKAQDVKTYAFTGNLGEMSESCSRKIEEKALQTVTVDGKVYGIPYNAWYQGVIYNKDIFKKFGLTPPETKEELEELVVCLKEHGVVPFAAHFQESWKVANMTMQYLMNDIFSENPGWGDEFREGRQNFRGNSRIMRCLVNNRMILENSWEDALFLEQFQSDSRFTQGEAAMYLTGSWSMQFADEYGREMDFGIFPYPAEHGEAKLIRETNLTFMKGADSEFNGLLDEILCSLLEDEKLIQEILGFTQSDSVVKGIEPGSRSRIQDDIDRYERLGKVIDVSVGNSQLIWEFQDSFAKEQLCWLQKEKTLEEALDYADQNREFSSYLE